MKWVYKVVCVLAAPMLCYAESILASDAIQVSEVARGIFVYQGKHEEMSLANLGAIGNSGFIVGEKAVAVIDPGGSPEFGEQLRRAIESTTDVPVKYLILTHFHPDHVAGSTAFADVEHVIAHEKYGQAMTQRAQFYLERFTNLLPGSVQEVFRLPTMEIRVGKPKEIDLGDRSLSVEAHAVAHTDNDLTVHDVTSNTLWASDLLFAGRTPSLDGSLKGWLNVLSILDERDYELTIPGHGTPASWSNIYEPQKGYLIQLNDEVQKMINTSMSLSQVLEMHDSGVHQSTPWALYALQHGSNLAKAYSELEWE